MSIVPYNATLFDWAPFARRALTYAGRSLRGSMRRPTGAFSTVNPIEYDARYEALRRAINRNAPAVENVILAKNPNVAPVSTTTYQIDVCGDLVSNSEFALKYIGDKFRMHAVKLRFRIPTAITMARCIVFYSKNPGDTPSFDAQTIIDPTQYTVLYDTMLYPQEGNQPRKNVLIKTVNCKKRITSIDRTGSTAGSIKTGQLWVSIWAENPSAATVQINGYVQALFSNK